MFCSSVQKGDETLNYIKNNQIIKESKNQRKDIFMKRIRCFKYFFILLLCVVTINQYEVKVFSIDQSMRVVDNENMIFDGTQKTAENNSRNLDSISNLINLNQGSLTVRFKLDFRTYRKTSIVIIYIK